jgi:murein DD-endopeptidase MepM/ murein hydrolase activator NlpD
VVVVRRALIGTGAAAAMVIVTATAVRSPAPVRVPPRSLPSAPNVRVDERMGAIEVSALQVRSLTVAVRTATTALREARAGLAESQRTLTESKVHLAELGRAAYVEAPPPGLSPQDGVLSEFGITSEQRTARLIVELVTAERAAADRVGQGAYRVRRADAVLAARRADLRVQQDRLDAMRRAAEGKARAAAERYRAGQPGSSGRFRGELLKPVSAPLSSTFGMRYDPYYHVWQLHAGIDLAAAAGTPIHAAADGWVARAGVNGGYGNYTCISHGVVSAGRLSTCYAHQSVIAVRAGQHVRRGQVIGRVGSTGAATGPHLHFEVRINGRPVNPLPWLP